MGYWSNHPLGNDTAQDLVGKLEDDFFDGYWTDAEKFYYNSMLNYLNFCEESNVMTEDAVCQREYDLLSEMSKNFLHRTIEQGGLKSLMIDIYKMLSIDSISEESLIEHLTPIFMILQQKVKLNEEDTALIINLLKESDIMYSELKKQDEIDTEFFDEVMEYVYAILDEQEEFFKKFYKTRKYDAMLFADSLWDAIENLSKNADGKREIMDCRPIQENIKKEVKEVIEKTGITPTITIIQVGNDYASSKYINQKLTHCADVGIIAKHIKLDEHIKEDDLIALIHMENQSQTNAVMVQLPIPRHLNEDRVLAAIDYMKDVDCLTITNIGFLHAAKNFLEPCTARGIIEVLDRNDISIEGKDVLVVGRSHIVGRPVAELFTQRNATVTLAHSKSNLDKCLSQKYDIIVSAIGKAKFFKNLQADVLIDVGINFDENGKMVGDIDLDTCKFNYATPVPNGIGRLTVACLLRNIVNATLFQHKIFAEASKLTVAR